MTFSVRPHWLLTIGLFSGVFLWLTPAEAADGSILVSCPLGCNLSVDGESVGVLPVDGTKKVLVSEGEHLVRASGGKGGAFSRIVTIKPGKQSVVEITFSSASVNTARQRSTKSKVSAGATQTSLGSQHRETGSTKSSQPPPVISW